jgi:hypothetical protein
MKRLIVAAAATAALAFAAPAWAADPTTSGTATISGGVATLTSDFTDASTANDFGAVTFAVPAGTTFASLATLSAEFNLTDGSCGGGSPRFDIALGNGQTVGVHFGPSPNFTGCAEDTWTSTGNVIGNNDAGRYEIRPGTPFTTYAQVLAAVGSQPVTSITVAVDGGWSQSAKKQVAQLRNVNINGQVSLVPETGAGGGKVNAAQLCKAERTRMGSAAAFNELWGTNANARNAFGKCVSTIAHARNAGKTQQQILDAITACQAQGKKGAALGACVAAKDGVAATQTEAQERAQSKPGQGKGKKKGHK